jgi:urease accessory protein
MKNARAAAASIALLAVPAIAHAHHAMDDATPSNLYEGLVSGLAHPVIGLDHLVFVLALGAACYCLRAGAAAVGAFLIATLVGTAAHLRLVDVPFAEGWVAATLLAAAVLLLRRSPPITTGAAAGFFALAGLVHGYAYGEAIVGAEATPLAAYLAGFTLIQLALVFAGYALARALDRRELRPARAFGGALSVAGAVFLALAVV